MDVAGKLLHRSVVITAADEAGSSERLMHVRERHFKQRTAGRIWQVGSERIPSYTEEEGRQCCSQGLFKRLLGNLFVRKRKLGHKGSGKGNRGITHIVT